jgi:hypothetical protein
MVSRSVAIGVRPRDLWRRPAGLRRALRLTCDDVAEVALKYGQSNLDISDEIDLIADRDRCGRCARCICHRPRTCSRRGWRGGSRGTKRTVTTMRIVAETADDSRGGCAARYVKKVPRPGRRAYQQRSASSPKQSSRVRDTHTPSASSKRLATKSAVRMSSRERLTIPPSHRNARAVGTRRFP